MKTKLINTFLAAAFFAVYILIPIHAGAQQPPAQPDMTSGQPPELTTAVKKQTIDQLAALLPERYAYKEIGPKLQNLLLQNLQAGKYARYSSPADFSAAVTKDMRSLNPDRHLALNYNPEEAAPSQSVSQQITPEERARQATVFNRQMNYGFRDVRFLNGNIGYLKFDYFDSYLDYSRSVVDASMEFFVNCDALIIDLRENGGGSGEMVGYIAGFFFQERTLTGTSYNRLTDTSSEEFIVPQSKEKLLRDIDIYVLTSKATISAAEALAYNLKYLRNAKIVGETSAGAANPGRVTRLNNLFTAFIPNRHGKHITTGTNWEGTGVPLDISCSAEDALRIARIDALTKLRQKAANPQQQKKYQNYLTYLEKSKSAAKLPEKTLLQYAGDYQGERNVIVKNGTLFYKRGFDPERELLLVAPDTFMQFEGDVTITFRRDDKGRVIELVSEWSLSSWAEIAKKLHD